MATHPLSVRLSSCFVVVAAKLSFAMLCDFVPGFVVDFELVSRRLCDLLLAVVVAITIGFWVWGGCSPVMLSLDYSLPVFC